LKSRAEVIERLRGWLIKRNPAAAQMAIDEHTDIIETRVLESLQLVEFILFIEQESGREILSESLDPKSLRTLGVIYGGFFA
jgi:acyl carrier protein